MKLLDRVEINPNRPARFAVIWLHGLGADGHDFEPLVPALALPESLPVRFVFPHAPTRSVTVNGGMVMRAWYDIVDISSPRVDVAAIQESSGYLQALIQRELDAGIASDHILLAGFSQGGAIALHTGLRHVKPLAGILALSTYLPTLDSLAETRTPANQTIPILMAHGKHDPLIPLSMAQKTREALRRLDYIIQWREYPMQHEVSMEEISDIRVWMIDLFSKHSGP